MHNMYLMKGLVKEEEIVNLSFLTYYDGTFQKYFTEHAKRITGFYEFFNRSYNQKPALSPAHSLKTQSISLLMASSMVIFDKAAFSLIAFSHS